MNSTLRIAASRANGAKSKGPITPEGKLVSAANAVNAAGPITPEGKASSSHNATRHGLLADSLVFSGEAEERFLEMISALRDELQPANRTQSHAIDIMAAAHWRRMRVWSLEKAHFIEETRKRLAAEGDDGSPPITQLARTFRSLADGSHTLELLRRYEISFSREYQRALASIYRGQDRKKEEISKRTEPNLG
jgi:hypothetical protein